MSDDARRDDLASRLLPWAIQGGYLVDAYAQLATHRRSPRLAVLAATFTRLYDDLLDETTDDTVGDRLGRLFAGGDLGAVSERECVLERVYRTLAELTPRQLHEPSYRALADLHRRQIQSLRQAGGPLTTTQLWDLTTAKGGLAMVVLGGLTRPQLTDAEVDRLYQLGGLLQLVDDYQDEGVDRRRGIRTLATSGVLMFNALAGRLRRLDGQYCATYGAASAKSFIDDLYLWLYVVGLVRLLRGRQSTPIRTGAKRRALAKNIVVLRRDAIR